MSERKFFYLITANEHNPDEVGKIEITDTRRPGAEKNVETTHQLVDPPTRRESATRYELRVVSLGYHDFESKKAYMNHDGSIVRRKLLEVDEAYLEKAGIDPDAVKERVEA